MSLFAVWVAHGCFPGEPCQRGSFEMLIGCTGSHFGFWIKLRKCAIWLCLSLPPFQMRRGLNIVSGLGALSCPVASGAREEQEPPWNRLYRMLQHGGRLSLTCLSQLDSSATDSSRNRPVSGEFWTQIRKRMARNESRGHNQ